MEKTDIFDMMDDSIESVDGILTPNFDAYYQKSTEKPQNKWSSVGIDESKMVPVMLMTDSTTATQITVLMGMIKHALVESGKTNKEVKFELNIKNRSNISLMFSIGNETIPPVAYEKTVYVGH